MDRNIKTVLLSEEEIHNRVAELGKQITQRYVGEDIVCIGVLKGCFIFMADLVRCIDLPAAIDFMVISSYGNGTSSGDITVKKDLSRSIEGKHVMIVEDILDSGHTLTFLKQYLAARNPASIEVAVLLNKPSRRQYPVTAEYIGFEIENEFVVGYGLDYAELYRNLPYIGILAPEAYAS